MVVLADGDVVRFEVDGDALLLAAGELVGAAVGQVADVEGGKEQEIPVG
ncbi:hypothetical protein [Streptacidiphilus jiangxiensis]|uniref:Uncharacterized protein n=1 Tax=Streptacidiphilus jiangxiensis TaxID=235985 RepID=A0A1H8BG39_STRJI|nr:hypothetical protein [Streptacidiphilus jiangxiensis]SEM81803.1 hypothetical protein SAMN05414137_1653 [Streptacidiphilus jiangxiensis]